jgi:nucleoside-diphosphate-sugar epimerase
MRVLLTGGGGFLGRHVARALLARGHAVRVLSRSRQLAPAAANTTVGLEEIHGDLCTSPIVETACEGIDAIVHLAAGMRGDAATMRRDTVDGTRKLLEAAAKARPSVFLLASSLSVYDWEAAGRELDEDSALLVPTREPNAYASTKLLQEDLVRRACEQLGIRRVVLRPGVIWGVEREYPPTIGQRLGRIQFVFGPDRQLPLIHAENAADAFETVLRPDRRAHGTFNLVDHPEITARSFVRESLRASSRPGLVVPVPYALASAAVRALHLVTPERLAARLPSFLDPAQFVARYRPLRVSGARFRREMSWSPPHGFEECLQRTFAKPALPQVSWTAT